MSFGVYKMSRKHYRSNGSQSPNGGYNEPIVFEYKERRKHRKYGVSDILRGLFGFS